MYQSILFLAKWQFPVGNWLVTVYQGYYILPLYPLFGIISVKSYGMLFVIILSIWCAKFSVLYATGKSLYLPYAQKEAEEKFKIVCSHIVCSQLIWNQKIKIK
jgi:hypothetical protein